MRPTTMRICGVRTGRPIFGGLYDPAHARGTDEGGIIFRDQGRVPMESGFARSKGSVDVSRFDRYSQQRACILTE